MRGWLTKVVFAAAAVMGSTVQAQNLPPEYFDAIIKSSVQFFCFDASGQGLWQGSGSFIGREGIILTNNHVVVDEDNGRLCPILRISMIKNEDQAPEPRYIGRVIARLPNVDLALVQISTDWRGNPVPSGTVFPSVPLGDSNATRIGERIFNFGFPDINGTSETITVSGGSVNGFLENRNLMKHDALSGPGGSGGGIYNIRGELIAVHSAGVSGNNNTRQPLGRPLILGQQMIQQNVRGFGEPWVTQFAPGFNPVAVTPINANPTTAVQPPPLPSGNNPVQPPPIPGGNAAGAPNFPPKPGQTWTVVLDGLAPWTLNFTELDEDNDPTGTATQNGNPTQTWAFETSSNEFRFQMVAADRNGSFFCDFERLQISGNAFIGGKSLRSTRNPSGGSNVLTNLGTTCVAAFGSSVQLAGSGTSVQPPPVPSTLMASFPPKPGQVWTMTIEGLAPWTLNFTKLDGDGDPTGTGTQNGVSKTVFAFTEPNGRRFFQVFDARNTVYYCIFPNAIQVSGSSLVGGNAFSAPSPDANAAPLNKSCTVTITADNNVQIGGAPVPSLNAPPPLPAAPAPPPLPGGGISQPPALPGSSQIVASLPPKPSQAWTLIIDGLAPWALNFTKLDGDGDPTGTGVQNGVSKPVFAYALQSGGFRFQVFNAQSAVFVCDFPRNTPISSATINGGTAQTAPNSDANLTPLNKSCNVTLNSLALTLKSSLNLRRASAPIDMMLKF